MNIYNSAEVYSVWYSITTFLTFNLTFWLASLFLQWLFEGGNANQNKLQVRRRPGLNATEAATPGLTIQVFFPVGDTAGCHQRSCATKCYGLCGGVGVWGGGGWVGLLRKLNWKGRSRGFPKLDLGRQSIEIWFSVCAVAGWSGGGAAKGLLIF